MNREQMVLNAYCVIGNTYIGVPGDEDIAAACARQVVDAILPQVSTVDELKALPGPTLLLGQADGWNLPRLLTWRGGQLYYGDGTRVIHLNDALCASPLTVVYQPEAPADA